MELNTWDGLLVYALHCDGIVVSNCFLWGQRTLVKEYNGP